MKTQVANSLNSVLYNPIISVLFVLSWLILAGCTTTSLNPSIASNKAPSANIHWTAFLERKDDKSPYNNVLLSSGIDKNGVHVKGPIYPINKGLHTAISRPAIAYSDKPKVFMVAVAERVTIAGIAAYDRVAIRFFDDDGILLQKENYLFDDKSSQLNDSKSIPSKNIGSVQIAHNSILDEFLVTMQRTTFYPKQLVTSKNGIWAQRISFSKGVLGQAIELVNNGQSDVHSHTLVYAELSGTIPFGGRYLMSYGYVNTLLMDSQAKLITVVPLDFGKPKGSQAQPDASFGYIKGKPLFLLVYGDEDNQLCQPSIIPCIPWSGVWGTYVDPNKTLYPYGADNTAFPISKIENHFSNRFSFQSRVAYNPTKKSFYVVWRELPNPTAKVIEKRSHIRGNKVDYYVPPNATTIPIPYNNQVISTVTGSCKSTPKPEPCLNIEDPSFVDIETLAGNKMAVYWQEIVKAQSNAKFNVKGKVITIS